MNLKFKEKLKNMEDIKLKSKRSKGRPAYVPNICQLKELYSMIDKRRNNKRARVANGSDAKRPFGTD